MKIPKKIKVGGHWLRIKYSDETDGFTGSGLRAGWKNIIVLQKEMAQSKREGVLFHELMHEIAWQMGMDLSEEAVSVISEMMYQILKDNKLLKE